jgi:hypothetical protein
MKLKSENVRKHTLRCDQAIVRVKVETDEKENKKYFYFCPKHKYQKSKNRLLKVCNVPATSAGLSRLLFLQWPLTVLMKQTRQAVHAFTQSI